MLFTLKPRQRSAVRVRKASGGQHRGRAAKPTLIRLTAWVLLGLIGLHVAAALFHQFVIRDDTLGRMLPGVHKMR